MKISAKIENSFNKHLVIVKTNDSVQEVVLPAKASGLGSAVNGGELLCLAIATCFCNDVYREAQKKNIKLTKVNIEAFAEFSVEGDSGYNFQYKAKLEGDASDEDLEALILHTDKVSEIQNTIRKGVDIIVKPVIE